MEDENGYQILPYATENPGLLGSVEVPHNDVGNPAAQYFSLPESTVNLNDPGVPQDATRSYKGPNPKPLLPLLRTPSGKGKGRGPTRRTIIHSISEKLYRAIQTGDSKRVERLLATLTTYIIDINELPRYGDRRLTPLMLASRNENFTILKALCRAGADVNAVDKYNVTALLYASQGGLSEHVIELCRQPGINPNITRTEEHLLGETALMYACWKCSPKAVAALIASGADVNAARKVDDEFTPLMYALYNTHGRVASEQIMGLLVNAGANVEAVDSEGEPVYKQRGYRPLLGGRTRSKRRARKTRRRK